MKKTVLSLIVQILNFCFILVAIALLMTWVGDEPNYSWYYSFIHNLDGSLGFCILAFILYWLFFKLIAPKANILVKAIILSIMSLLIYYFLATIYNYIDSDTYIAFIGLFVVTFSGAFLIPFSEKWIAHGLHKIGKK
jgi:hypothetical protein